MRSEVKGNTISLSYTAGTIEYVCTPATSTETLTFEQPLSSARVVSHIVAGSTASVTVVPSGSITHTQTGSIVSWDTGRTGTFARFVSFNVDTAQFGQGDTINPAAHTAVNFAQPALGSPVYGQYEELLAPDGQKTMYFNYDNIDLSYRQYGTGSATPGQRQLRLYQASL